MKQKRKEREKEGLTCLRLRAQLGSKIASSCCSSGISEGQQGKGREIEGRFGRFFLLGGFCF